MELNIISFGKLAELIPSQSITLPEGIHDTESLKDHLIHAYPGLGKTKFKMAVDREIIQHERPLIAGSTVALMPPFSGG